MGTGGIIGKKNPSTASSASGMWSVNEVFLRNTVGNEWPSFNAADSVSYNLFGGGGGGSGSNYRDNGGGAGSLLVQGTFAPTGGVAYTVTIGAGGVGWRYSSGVITAGTASSIVGIVNASAGGNGSGTGQPGVSGYGQGGSNSTYSGGQSAERGGGGGAGAGANGSSGSNFTAAAGGAGVSIPLHPTGLTAGGGGGGGGHYGGSSGGSGAGAGGSNAAGTSGSVNTGAGGGGGWNVPSTGGSGRVIFRYVDTFPAAAATTGSPTITVSGGYRYYDFTSSGSIVF